MNDSYTCCLTSVSFVRLQVVYGTVVHNVTPTVQSKTPSLDSPWISYSP